MRGCVFTQDDAGKKSVSFEQCLWLIGGLARLCTTGLASAALEGKICSIHLNNSMSYLFFEVRVDRLTMLNWMWKTLNCKFC